MKEINNLKFYFEVEIVNGGFEDDIIVGISTSES